jgi:hypothetical protein
VIHLSVTNSKCLPWRLSAETRRLRLRGVRGLGVSFDIDAPSDCLIANTRHRALCVAIPNLIVL